MNNNISEMSQYWLIYRPDLHLSAQANYYFEHNSQDIRLGGHECFICKMQITPVEKQERLITHLTQPLQ